MPDGEPLTRFQRAILRRLTIAMAMFTFMWLADYGETPASRIEEAAGKRNEFEDFDAKMAGLLQYVKQHHPNADTGGQLGFVDHFEKEWHLERGTVYALLEK